MTTISDRLSEMRFIDPTTVEEECAYKFNSVKSEDDGRGLMEKRMIYVQKEFVKFFSDHSRYLFHTDRYLMIPRERTTEEGDVNVLIQKYAISENNYEYEFTPYADKDAVAEMISDKLEDHGAQICWGRCTFDPHERHLLRYELSMKDNNEDGQIDEMIISENRYWTRWSWKKFGRQVHKDHTEVLMLSGVDFQPFFSALLAAAMEVEHKPEIDQETEISENSMPDVAVEDAGVDAEDEDL